MMRPIFSLTLLIVLVTGIVQAQTVEDLTKMATDLIAAEKYDEAKEYTNTLLRFLEGDNINGSVLAASILSAVAMEYTRKDRFADAEPLYKKTLEVLESKLDKNDPNLAAIMNNVGMFYDAQKRYTDAELLYKKVMKIYESKPNDPINTALTLNNLAWNYDAQGRHTESVPLYEKAFTIRKAKLGEKHPETLVCLEGLATQYDKLGNYDKAETLHIQFLKIVESMYGKNNFEIIPALDSFIKHYEMQGRYDDAKPLYERSFNLYELTFGKEPSDLVRYLNVQAVLYKNQNCNFGAEWFYRQSLGICETKLGKDHSLTLKTLENLALLYYNQSCYPEAETLLKQVLEINEEKLGKDHPDVATNLNNLAGTYAGQGRYADAETLYKRSLDIREATSGRNHPETAAVLNNLALRYQAQGRYVEAEPLFKRALEIKEVTSGKNHSDTAIIMSNMGRFYILQRRYADAESLLKRALEIYETVYGKDDSGTMIVLHNIAELSMAQERYAEAESLMKRIFEVWEVKRGKDHPLTGGIQGFLAKLYTKQCRYAEAECLYDRSITIFENRPTEANHGYDKYHNRALLYRKTNRPEKAIADLKKAMDLSLEVRKNASGSDTQRAETFANYYHLFETMVDWQYELGDRNEAYIAMERSRAQGLQDLINSGGIDLLQGVPDDIAQKLRADENKALSDIASFDKQRELAKTEAEKARLTAAQKDAQRRLVEVMAAIRSASPNYRLMVGEDRKPIALDTIRKEIEAEKGLVLEYLIGSEKSYVLIYGLEMEPKLLPLELTESQGELFDVEKGSLTAEKLQTILQNDKNTGVLQSVADPKNITESFVPDTKIQKKLNTLWTLLIPDENIRTKITKSDTLTQLLILPDGELTKLPFEMLIIEPDTVNPQYLLDSRPACVYAPSASMYYNLKQRKLPPSKKVLTVGNPDYTVKSSSAAQNTIDEMFRSRRAARLGTLPMLPWTEKETEWIETSCNENNIAVTRLDKKASTEANVRKNTSGKKIVHLACHGLAEDDFGNMFGCLALTIGNENNSDDDGFLTLAEMFGLDLKSCDLAVLSACETNLGPNQHGEGTWSMGRGMLASGAKRVVTTDWQVADDASAYLTYWFVDQVNQSADSANHAKLLQQSKQAIRKRTDHPAWQHPYYWAPFVLIGAN